MMGSIRPYAVQCWMAAAIWIAASCAQAQTGTKLPFGDRLPSNAKELIEMRAFFDQTVWSPEVAAQNHEQYFVKLWDQLIHEPDKYRVLGSASFGKLLVGTTPETTDFDWGVQMLTFPQGRREIPLSAWLEELKTWEQAGYEIGDTEWHHSAFEQPADGPAKSVVAMIIHVTHPKTQRRFLIKGDLKLTWRAGEVPVPELVDATGLKVYQRQGTPAYTEALQIEVKMDPTGREARTTLHPVLIQDLNDDGLPEIALGGENKVFWNRGNFKFDAQRLCRVDPGHVNAGVFADLTGDGIRDFVAAPKSGVPMLYRGEPNGKFDGDPIPLRFADERLTLPVAVTAGDIDSDGDLDLFIGQQKPGYESGDIPTPYYDCLDSFPAYLLVNDGQGNFRDVTATSGIGKKRLRRNFSSSFIDLDHDGDLDLIMTSDFSGTDIFLNDGKGTFTDTTESIRPRAAAFGMSHTFGDYNRDGRIDFVTIGMSSTTARRLAALKLGREEFPDYNEERMNMGYGNRMYLNTGNGFEQAPFNQSVARTGWSWGSTTLDFDNDADQDVYIVNGQTSGKTTQDYCTRFWCHDIYYKKGARPDKAVKEFFGGLGSVFAGNSISWNGYEHNALLMNGNASDFLNVGFLMDAASVLDSRAAASADFDGDGRVDLLFEHVSPRESKQVVFVLKNQWDQPGHWIGVQLRQSAGTTSPIGAVVRAKLKNGQLLLQHNVTGHSVWAQHDNTVHFGLGKETDVESIEITWPNGKTTKLEAPAADKYHVVLAEKQ